MMKINPEDTTILIVDDTTENRVIAGRILKNQGFRVAEVASGTEAFEFTLNKIPDLILLDIMMPGMDGFETCRRLRNSEPTARIPIIFMTALSRSESIEKAFESGGSDYITKPFIMEELLARIRLHLQLQRTGQQALETMAELEKSRDDLQSILNQMQVGTIILDEDQTVRFVSDSCSEIADLKQDTAQGRHWKEILPLSENSIDQLADMIGKPPDKTNRVTLIFQSTSKQTRWLDTEVRQDPRNPERSIIYLYDRTEVHTLRSQIQQTSYIQMIGNSPAMLRMFESFEQVAEGDWTVLIEGETGSGKELVARSIHASSRRRNGPFIAVNCAGLSETLLASQLFGHRKGSFTGAIADQAGFFEAAEKGTLFLDEIGEIPLNMQASLLRTLQEHEIIRVGDTQSRRVDVRILTATNRDLGNMVKQGLFREDLLYRIRVARIAVPPLRERTEDIPILVNTFLSERRIAMGRPTIKLSPAAMQTMLSYHWPGNVRELKNVVDHCIIHCRGSLIESECLPDEVKAAPASQPTESPQPADASPAAPITRRTWEDDESREIMEALRQARGNRSKAAKLLNISRATLYRRLEKLSLSAE